MQKFTERLKLIGKEILNIITNIVVPLWGAVMIIAEVIGLPANVLEILKKVEYVLFYFKGTKDDIEKTVDNK